MSFVNTLTMSLKNLLFVTLVVGIFQTTFAQRNYNNNYNRLGITGGLTLFDITTSDLNTQQREGVAGGFTTRGSIYNNFDLVYGLGFYSSEVGIMASPTIDAAGRAIDSRFIDYQLQSAQLTFLGSLNIVRHHLSLEAGPVLNISGKLKLKSDSYDSYIIDGYETLTAGEIQDISKVNFHVAGGITGGLEQFRVSAQYQYGVTNSLNKLNEQNLENSDFDGHSSLFTFSAIFYF